MPRQAREVSEPGWLRAESVVRALLMRGIVGVNGLAGAGRSKAVRVGRGSVGQRSRTRADGSELAMTEPTRSDDLRPPSGDVYDWYMRGMELLTSGDAAAASQLLAHAIAADPQSHSLREAYARALFDAGRYPEARASFEQIVAADPADDYAQFGLGVRRLPDRRSSHRRRAPRAGRRDAPRP